MMRRMILLVVGVVVAVLAVPILGIGQPISTHGGTPSEFFTTNYPGVCAQVDAEGPSKEQRTDVALVRESHLNVSFTAEWLQLTTREHALIGLDVLDEADSVVASTGFEWGFGGNWISITSSTVTWTFPNIPAGDYSVRAVVRVERWNQDGVVPGKGSAALHDCALSVFVIPPAA